MTKAIEALRSMLHACGLVEEEQDAAIALALRVTHAEAVEAELDVEREAMRRWVYPTGGPGFTGTGDQHDGACMLLDAVLAGKHRP
jgi:hypothetical protein